MTLLTYVSSPEHIHLAAVTARHRLVINCLTKDAEALAVSQEKQTQEIFPIYLYC